MARRQRWASRVVTPLEITESERALWDELCRDDPHLRSAFYTYTYARAVAAVRPHVFVTIIERQGEPVGFFPFQFANRWTRLLRAAEPVGGDMTDYFGIVAKPDVSLTPYQLLRLSRLSSLLFTHLDESQLKRGLTGENPEPGLRIELPEGADAYWAALRKADKHFVADTERLERRLIEKVGALRFQYQYESDDRPAGLRHLIEEKRRQYARTGVADPLSAPWKRDLLFRLLSCTDPSCTGVLSVLSAGETWAASHFDLCCGGVLHDWFPVYNQDLRAYGPGRLLYRKNIAASAETGIIAIDRGAGDAPAKRDFASVSHTYYRGLWSRPGARSLCFRLIMSLKWRVS